MSFTLEGRLSGRHVVVVWDEGEVDAGRSTERLIDLVEALEDEVEAPDGSLVMPSLTDEDCALASIVEVLDDVDVVERGG